MIPRLELTTRQRAAAADIFFEYLRDRSSIVRTWAMDALARLAQGDADLRKRVVPLIEDLTETGTPAMRARGRKLLQHLNRRRVKA